MWLRVLIPLQAYLLGALSFAKWLARLKGIDLSKEGSGNLGATNLWRAAGRDWGLLCLLLDASKGYVACVLAAHLSRQDPLWIVLAGACAILGHTFSPWANFKGGKGAATGLGVLLFLSPSSFGIALAVAFAVIRSTSMVSLGTLMVLWMIPLLFVHFKLPQSYTFFSVVAALYITWKHKGNIARIVRGNENKIKW